MNGGNSHEEKECSSVLANESNFLAWVQTGIIAFAAGLGIERFLGGVIPLLTIRSISMAMILFGIVAFAAGAWRYQHVAARLPTTKVKGAPVPLVLLLSFLLIIVGGLALVGVWLVD